jgi:catechol 2,3-dioxygenase-like lactoylglutathione lyase family enzyme
MSLTLDHLVVLVRDLERTIADYEALGFTVQRGGTHADGATHNALVGFADGSYVELIAFLRPAPEHRWGKSDAAGIEGFIDFALLPGSVGEVVAAAKSRGLDYAGPFDGGRVRLDGERLAWQIGTPTTTELPFLCGDVTPRALRVREGEVRVHPNGVTGVASLTLAVTDLEASLQRYRALLGPGRTQEAGPIALPGLGVRLAALALGQSTLVLVSPIPEGDDPASLVLSGVRARRGPGLIGVALRSGAATIVNSLPLALTHGARFEIHPA